MAREDNLRPGPMQSSDEARENGRKGGVASGEARRKKKAMREAAEMVLSLTPTLTKKQRADLVKAGLDPNEEIDVQFLSLFAAGGKALKGDLAAIQLLRDTAGEQPVKRMEVSEVDSGWFKGE